MPTRNIYKMENFHDQEPTNSSSTFILCLTCRLLRLQSVNEQNNPNHCDAVMIWWNDEEKEIVFRFPYSRNQARHKKDHQGPTSSAPPCTGSTSWSPATRRRRNRLPRRHASPAAALRTPTRPRSWRRRRSTWRRPASPGGAPLRRSRSRRARTAARPRDPPRGASTRRIPLLNHEMGTLKGANSAGASPTPQEFENVKGLVCWGFGFCSACRWLSRFCFVNLGIKWNHLNPIIILLVKTYH